MKMQPATFAALSSACEAVIVAVPYAAQRYADLGHTSTRYRWDVLHKSGFGTSRLYAEGLNDATIETALRRIMPSLPAPTPVRPAYETSWPCDMGA